MYCCGLNKEGQLGQGTSSQHPDFSRPQPISIPGKITQVACGSHSTIALAGDSSTKYTLMYWVV